MRKIITSNDIAMIADVDNRYDTLWVSIGHVASQGILVEGGEWEAFIKLVKDADNAVKSMKDCK